MYLDTVLAPMTVPICMQAFANIRASQTNYECE